MPRVAVVGGSLGGLTAALLLRDLGCEVEVLERSCAKLEARGAGIAVLEATRRYPVERLGVAIDAFCSAAEHIRFLESDGSILRTIEHPYRFSSWNAVYRVLLDGFGSAHYRLGTEVSSFVQDDAGVTIRLTDGSTDRFDLLVCADGISSAARSALLPDVAARYAGYVAWRGVIPERELAPATFDALFDALTYQVLPGSHILVYPIPGPSGGTKPGERFMNIVWYRNVPDDQLADLLTDNSGVKRSVSVPPGLMRDDFVTEMQVKARETLAPPIAEVVTAIPEPFVQAVYDIDVPKMAFGRVCILGDAAFAARPHAAAGTAKAAEDGWVLADELQQAHGDVLAALPAWENRQVALGKALLKRTREVGDGSQFNGTFGPDDPQLIFGLHEPGR